MPDSNEHILKDILEMIGDVADFCYVNLRSVHDRNALGDTPLHVAAMWGDVEVGKVLLDAGADPNVQGEYGFTPLHVAVSFEHVAFVRLLLEAGASPEIRTTHGFDSTAKEIAERKGNRNIMTLLNSTNPT